jgi:hypothetical protein
MASKATNRSTGSGRQGRNAERQTTYSGDSLRYNIKNYRPSPQQVPYGEAVDGKLFGLKQGATVISFYPGIMDTHMRRENEKAKPLRARALAVVKDAFGAKQEIYSPDIVADGLIAYMSSAHFGSEPYVDFAGIAPARNPTERRGHSIASFCGRSLARMVRTARSVFTLPSCVSQFAVRPSTDHTGPCVPSCSSQFVMQLTSRQGSDPGRQAQKNTG